MARTSIYTWYDSNLRAERSLTGDGYTLFALYYCGQDGGLGIRITDAGAEVGFGCYRYGSLRSAPNNQGVDPAQPYDCINGGCIPKTTYNTPGVFATLAACQSGCAKNSNCTGECVSAEELAALQQAANNLQSKFCK